VLRRVKVGSRNEFQAEILDGLEGRESVIVHPSDKVADGVSVRRRGS